jgi:competence protein ComEC
LRATIACVNVGQGDCTVAVDDVTGEGMLIDCRSGHHERALAELALRGLTELRAAIVSHSQMDHFGGVLDVLEGLADRFTGSLHVNHDSFMATPVAGDNRKVAGRKLRALFNRAREYGDRIQRADADGPDIAIGSIVAELLAPAYGDILAAIGEGDPNRASAIVLLRVGADCIIIGGDAPLVVWERVAERLPRGCVVRWPHHGGGIGPDADAHARLRDLLDPSIVVVSVGAANTHGHPTPAFFAALGGRPGRLLCTEATGACLADGKPLGSCAGTIRVHAAGTGTPTVIPGAPDHASLVASLGNAQCLPEANLAPDP